MAHTGRASMYLQVFSRFLRRGFNIIYGVFFPHFDDPEHEKNYYSQEWYLGKVGSYTHLHLFSLPSIFRCSL